SKDGSTMISYAADSHVLYGELYYRPAKNYPEGSLFDVYEWDTGKFLGKIKQVQHTYSVVGNMNEYQVSIGETTYGGLPELQDTTAILDYGNIIYLALERSKTAREAIKVISDLTNEYGFCSAGESFSIADPNEVWIMEIIGKGPGNKGAIWVARMIPDGYICAHANHARITTFPFSNTNKWDDPNQMTYHSPDIISFAREKGLFKGSDQEFSFSDTYAPVDFSGARFCEIRVWAFFNSVNKDMNQYWDYAKGHVKYNESNGYASNRMPLWIKPDRKISVRDMMNFMRDHLEGTELYMGNDIGAGPYGNPYRWRPLTWEVDSQTYCNERATATQQTGFSFVTQARSWLPDPIGGINWFSVDDAASTVYVPMYCGITEVPEAYAVGNGAMMEFSVDAAFWIFNLVSNFAYTRWSLIHPEIYALQQKMEKLYVEYVEKADSVAMGFYEKNHEDGIKIITGFSVFVGNKTVKKWSWLFKYLFVKYMDGNVKTVAESKEGYKYVTPNIEQPGYSEEWYQRIVKETGDRFKVIGDAH
ncbi:MAG: C69 family dipeptidase, partial [Bacteroidota bacterium]